MINSLPRSVQVLFVASLCVALAGLGGCATHGIEIENLSGFDLRYRTLDLNPDGSATTVAEGVVARGTTFSAKIDPANTRFPKQVAFSLLNANPGHLSELTLDVPTGGTRFYNIAYYNGRLAAFDRMNKPLMGLRTHVPAPEPEPEDPYARWEAQRDRFEQDRTLDPPTWPASPHDAPTDREFYLEPAPREERLSTPEYDVTPRY